MSRDERAITVTGVQCVDGIHSDTFEPAVVVWLRFDEPQDVVVKPGERLAVGIHAEMAEFLADELRTRLATARTKSFMD